jgi:putative protease
VQDLGLARLIHRLVPSLPLHASTQMTLTEPRGIELVRGLGVGRVILARELSLADIQKITSQTPTPVEVFVHGALCVSYSGQCAMSYAIGGRSGNRGQCAQPCRRSYRLVDRNGAPVGNITDPRYLLSLRDLNLADDLPDLLNAGVRSFKIEGRLKDKTYVMNVVGYYRQHLDRLLEEGWEPPKSMRPIQDSLKQVFDLALSWLVGGEA